MNFKKMTPTEQLNLFQAKAEELRDSKLLRKGFDLNVTINWNKMQGINFMARQPDETELRAFLLTFRQFISKKEPIFIYRIYNLCQKSLVNDKFKEHLIKSRSIWEHAQKSCGINFIYNGQKISPEYAVNLWVNGYYFHSDEEKLKTLHYMLPPGRMLSRFQFLSFIQDATRQILYLDNIIKISFKEGYFRFD